MREDTVTQGKSPQTHMRTQQRAPVRTVEDGQTGVNAKLRKQGRHSTQRYTHAHVHVLLSLPNGYVHLRIIKKNNAVARAGRGEE